MTRPGQTFRVIAAAALLILASTAIRAEVEIDRNAAAVPPQVHQPPIDNAGEELDIGPRVLRPAMPFRSAQGADGCPSVPAILPYTYFYAPLPSVAAPSSQPQSSRLNNRDAVDYSLQRSHSFSRDLYRRNNPDRNLWLFYSPW